MLHTGSFDLRELLTRTEVSAGHAGYLRVGGGAASMMDLVPP